MASKQRGYQIVDEPRPKAWEYLIVNPIAILFAAILLPLFWTPPLGGRYWLPALWLLFNGYSLGSPTLGRELRDLLIGTALWLVILYGGSALVSNGVIPFDSSAVAPYLRLILNGVFFLTLYVVVFRQETAFSLHEYLKERNT